MLSKSLSTSEKFGSLVERAPEIFEFCHALYPLLVSHSDDFGRLQGDPYTVKTAYYPASQRTLQEFRSALQVLHDADLVIWYPIESKWFIQIVKFEEHQQGLHKRTRSRFPESPGDFPETSGHSGSVANLPSEEKRTKQNGTEEKKDVSPEAASGSGPTTAPPVLEYPVVGKGGPVWGLTATQIAEWVELFPNIDVLQSCRNALAWVKADPSRRKTTKGMARFLSNWLTGDVSRRRGGSAPSSTVRPAGGYVPKPATWECPHAEPCENRTACDIRKLNPKYPLKLAVSR